MTMLDFNIIDTYNSLTIGIADASTYDPIVPIANPSLEITPPGGFSKVTIPFTPMSINIINSNMAGITIACDYDGLYEMPDGIWVFKYSIKPNLTSFVSKYFMRTTLIECKLQSILLKNLLSEGDPIINATQLKSLLDVQLMIEGSIAAANKGDVQTANSIYKKASSVLENLNQKCDNCGNM